MRWDDIEILQAIDRHQEQHGGIELWTDGRQLMEEMAGGHVPEDQRHRGFTQELLNLQQAGLLTFEATGNFSCGPATVPYLWLQQVRKFALTTAGQDRARGRLVIQPLPDPSEDDGRPISSLILKQVAAAIEAQYRPDQIPVFLRESGIPLDRVPHAAEAAEDDVYGLLAALDQWGSEGRRVLRAGFSAVGWTTSSSPGRTTKYGLRSLTSSPAKAGTSRRTGLSPATGRPGDG